MCPLLTGFEMKGCKGILGYELICCAGGVTQGIGSNVYGADKQPSISIRGRNSPMESERQAPDIGKTRRGDDQSAKVDGVASSSGWDLETGNMLIYS